MAVEALAELKYEKDIKIRNNDIPLEDRQAVVARVARPNISHFLSEKRMFSRAARKIRSLTAALCCMIT